MKKQLGALLQVELVVGSESIARPGAEPMTMKQYTSGLLVGEMDDNHVLLPPERYVKEDFRLVKKEKGGYVCEPDAEGRHGDTFDAVRLANHALNGTGAAVAASVGTKPSERAGRAMPRNVGAMV